MTLLIGFGLLFASYLIRSLFSRRQRVDPAALDEFSFPRVDEGAPQIVVFGQVVIEAPQVLWYGNYRTSKIKRGGK